MKSLLAQVLQDQERESWEETTKIQYRMILKHKNKSFSETLPAVDIPNELSGSPHGVTKVQAIDLVGRGGIVWQVTTSFKRIQ